MWSTTLFRLFVILMVFLLAACSAPQGAGAPTEPAATAAPVASAVPEATAAPSAVPSAAYPAAPVAPPAVNAYPAPGMPSGGMPGVSGTIEQVDGTTVIIRRIPDNTPLTVSLASDAQILKIGEAAASDLAVGAAITVFGELANETLRAGQIQIGTSEMPASMSGMPGIPGGAALSFASGSIQAIAGSVITLLLADGNTRTVETSESTRYQMTTSGSAADLVAGSLIMVEGSAAGDTFAATRVQIVPALMP